MESLYRQNMLPNGAGAQHKEEGFSLKKNQERGIYLGSFKFDVPLNEVNEANEAHEAFL